MDEEKQGFDLCQGADDPDGDGHSGRLDVTLEAPRTPWQCTPRICSNDGNTRMCGPSKPNLLRKSLSTDTMSFKAEPPMFLEWQHFSCWYRWQWPMYLFLVFFYFIYNQYCRWELLADRSMLGLFVTHSNHQYHASWTQKWIGNFVHPMACTSWDAFRSLHIFT